MAESQSHENPRILCLHGFRNSAKILKTQIHKWPESVLEKLDLVYLDAPYPSRGKSGVEGIFDPPYFEWFQGNQVSFPAPIGVTIAVLRPGSLKTSTPCWGEAHTLVRSVSTRFAAQCIYSYTKRFRADKGIFIELMVRSVEVQDFTEYENFEECIAFIEDFMVKNGPFDGLLGFSQGAVLAAALPGMQAEGLVLTKVPNIKFLILISGAKFGGSKLGVPPLAASAFSSPVNCPSLHVIGENDIVKLESIALLDSFVDPIVIHHPEGHTIPRLDDQSLEIVNNFTEKIRNLAAV